MDKVHQHMESLASSVCKQQGGTNRDAGPSSASAPKESGDKVTNPSRFTRQDNSLDQGGGTKNPYLEV